MKVYLLYISRVSVDPYRLAESISLDIEELTTSNEQHLDGFYREPSSRTPSEQEG